jgi:D-alanyl-D-alanine carboxypeptidase
MRRFALAFFLTLVVSNGIASGAAEEKYGKTRPLAAEGLRKLFATYGKFIAEIDENEIVMSDGRRIIISDGRANKSYEQLLNEPDLDDMFAFEYVRDPNPSAPKINYDPGRIRVEGLFVSIYGDCVNPNHSQNVRKVNWLPKWSGGSVVFSTLNGADMALEAVSAELETLPKTFKPFLVNVAGGYNCRPIAGTSRRSMHSYGVAIDINTKFSAYWRWDEERAKDKKRKWRNSIPMEIVEVFERHGFIWGGRWDHYDTMHFEYRPEFN